MIISVVTGANSGIGRATAIQLASEGHVVYGTVRSLDKAGKLQSMAGAAGVDVNLVELDVADDESVRNGFGRILDETDGVVDVLVNNAGVGANAVVEECPPARYLDVMNVNLCGAVRCLQQVLPGMRDRRRGAIVNITSIAGRVAALAQSPYVASKWAFEGLSEGLAQELAPFGIRVVIVEPGVTKSAIFAKNVDAPNHSGAYDAHYRRMFQFYATGHTQATDPFEVGRLIHHAVTTDAPQLRYAISWGATEMIAGRQSMSDEQWMQLGAQVDDDEYYRLFKQAFAVDIAP
ncbi:MAG TPA: SDR family oxidoreductase [Ilumatobacteraceae bacterium]|nr:SDR family oxidoreductase [Ilumatobacteraceae bacterium]